MENNARPKMDRTSRAKQFIPFDALKGFREALMEKEKIIVSKKAFPQEKEEELDAKLRQIHKMDIVTAEFFQNGQYRWITGEVSAIDKTKKVLHIAQTGIPFSDISELWFTL